jgi:ATP-dependent DNA helicase RecG
MFFLKDTVSSLPGMNPKNIKSLLSLGIKTIEDLLYYFPFRYEDFSEQKKIIDIRPGETVTVRGKVIDIKNPPTRGRRKITEVYIEDETASVKAVWFNFMMPLKFLSRGKFVQFSGKVSLFKGKEIYFQHPNFELISKTVYEKSNQEERLSSFTGSTSGLIPVYSESKTVNSYFLRRIIQTTLDKINPKEFIPKKFIQEQKLPEIKKALKNIHFPENLQEAKLAKKRFAFEKMFLIQIQALSIKQKWEQNSAFPIDFDQKITQHFVTSLPFDLTNAQKKTSWQIIQDLEKNQPMNRLLEGDVGTGKTIVAVMAILSALNKGFQVAVLAPTEVLAIQHYSGINKFLDKYQFKIGLLTGSQNKINPSRKEDKINKKDFNTKIKTGEIGLIIGTHAVIQEKVTFKNLALVIIDEQHRFGVNQRAFLQQRAMKIKDGSKKTLPHLLTMTATPIPRTLSLALFGNLDLSIIDEYPQGKKEIITKIIPSQKRALAYNFIKKRIQVGEQVFVICPLVEESSNFSTVKSAIEEHENLQKNIFPDLKIALLHGKMKAKEKEKIMSDFKEKKFNILVSTSVIEVGIDIPNATVIVVEGAERFGLAQLHQFRGRVGRGKKQSYCFLFTSKNAPEKTARLKNMEKTNDGFKIAEADLKLRGPGQFIGTLQSGTPDVAMESLSDVKLIQSARIYAQSLLKYDPNLKKFPLLKEKSDLLSEKIHFE